MPRAPTITPEEFIRKWKASSLKERAAAQEHFIDLCRLLGEQTPAEADPDGTWYTFEKGAEKQDGGDGYADVWRRGHFAWEYKGKHKNLDAAYDQLLQYRESLENPPCLVVCDTDAFRVHTNFTGTAKQVHSFGLADLVRESPRKVLEAVFRDPERLKPGVTIEQVTEEAAGQFAELADRLRGRGVDPQVAAHFLDRILFCLFAEDVNLLPRGLFQKLVVASEREPDAFCAMLADLFRAMEKGGRFGTDRILHFNGGLFSDATVVPLTREEIGVLDGLSKLDWGQIEPAIFGTLFERGLDPQKRSQIGAHYTDRTSILRVVEPVLMGPLRREWTATKDKVQSLLAKGAEARAKAAAAAKGAAADSKRFTPRTPAEVAAQGAAKKASEVLIKSRNEAKKLIERFRRDHLDSVRVLDPACGSGNFLYVALELLHDIEKEAMLLLADVEGGQFHLDIRVGPQMVHGIEINPYAHELAQVTIWIGHLQWMIKNGFAYETNPVLKPIQTIDCRDAVLDLKDPKRPKDPPWPEADVVIGNPPFLGGKRMRAGLGDDYVDALFQVYDGRVPREADLVTYWFEKARAAIEAKRLRRAGLLGTQSIRGGASRAVLARIIETGGIFMAWSDEPWVIEGANVRISLIGFDDGSEKDIQLDGTPAAVIHADLSGGTSRASSLDLTKARRLKENLGIAFMGDTRGGAFDIPGDLAREWLALPPNPNGRPNSDVVRLSVNAKDITARSRGMFIIDFGTNMTERDAAFYELPFEYVRKHVRPERENNRRAAYRDRWWLHVEPRPAFRQAIKGFARFLVTPAHSKHRLFTWLSSEVLPDHALFAFARDDDYFFGVLQSSHHQLWALQLCSALEDRPRYTTSTCFETFPFPIPTAVQRARIAAGAKELGRLRDAWLNPTGATSADLKKRTLTALYNERPAWLQNTHAELDAAIAAAYGWPADLPEEEVLAGLLALNLEREPA